MSGFVPKRVSQARTAMGSTDANSTGKNGHSIVSTIGRRSTLLRGIQTRSFGSMWQIDYLNAAGNKCRQEELVPTFSTEPLQLASDTGISLTVFQDGNTAGFVRKNLQNALVSLYGGSVYTDKYCAMGNINGNVGDNITVPNDLTRSGTLSPAAGRKIIAIERWLTSGWLDNVGNNPWGHANDPNGLVLVLEGSTILPANCPAIRLSGVGPGGVTTLLTPTEVHTNVSAPFNGFGGINIGNFIVILYGGGPGATQAAVDFFFSSTLGAGKSKNFTLEFVNT